MRMRAARTHGASAARTVMQDLGIHNVAAADGRIPEGAFLRWAAQLLSVSWRNSWGSAYAVMYITCVAVLGSCSVGSHSRGVGASARHARTCAVLRVHDLGLLHVPVLLGLRFRWLP